MKKNVLALVAGLVLTASSAMAQNTNGYIGKARGISHECLSNYNGPNWEEMVSVDVIGSCFVEGFITQVTFSVKPVQPPCTDPEAGCNPPGLPIVIAGVTFGCDGEVISSFCY